MKDNIYLNNINWENSKNITKKKENDVCEIGSFISVTDADVPKDVLQIKFSQPKFGTIINKVIAETIQNSRACPGMAS